MKKSPIYLIAVCTKDGIIGINGKLPWDDIPKDLWSNPVLNSSCDNKKIKKEIWN